MGVTRVQAESWRKALIAKFPDPYKHDIGELSLRGIMNYRFKVRMTQGR